MTLARKARRQPDAAGYEASDVSIRVILLAGVGLFAGIGLSILIAFGILSLVKPVPQPPSRPFRAQPLGGPRLEVSPLADRARLQAQAQGRLEGYGWTDKANQIAHIPIDRAMAILATRGWPDQVDRQGGNP
ncbi:hypothetical protein HGP17_10505 [Rhizobium sp. P38BS-XIX]|uniref:hypothetical protein n=1 Tax=Rhizobium sp. P38BS-XIX TaxID=2726740 RepID=UPI0014570432|nr:hypothetical protein [Rhizobium sp. P38BS-XIX]NLR97262.1 hypothetical protein [Rhizobium sp. P38BS-XIX]